ncbi:VOC family protein [Celeribacter indicus]|uniref:Catechol 2,3-dioxygenase n=1 Tax=Celeribacter indicus TaxID=1208324 RepID=A0A0B5DN84_9RHOB|nr:VOC family protein [Celeribacter indicus]AJE45068.1 catechol 2,3-dioxygenase [Celeribacter indicus]SDX42530.1 catechol 2,3-dioxygenase [Celeribacter indicus]
MALQKLSHATLRVKHLEESVEFHTSVLGLEEIGREDGRVYLTCGTDGTYDVAVTEGGTGVISFAIAADDEEDLAHYRKRVEGAGVEVREMTDPDPGVVRVIEFDLPPQNQKMQIALLKREARQHYYNPAQRATNHLSALAPVDLDHITLRVGPDATQTIEFLSTHVDFRASDIVEFPGGAGRLASWMHVGDYHHDVAMFAGAPHETLDHLAWNIPNIEFMKLMLDQLARGGITTEAGPGRHAVGSNLYSYFRTPCGNRYELSGEMPRCVDRKAGPKMWTADQQIFSSWGAAFPESFKIGS